MAFGERIAYQQQVILPLLKNNEIVLMDRYILSSLVYECGGVHKNLSDLIITPDLGLLLDTELHIVLDRINERENETLAKGEDLLLNNLKERYLKLGKLNDYQLVDTTKDDTSENIINIVNCVKEMLSMKE